MRPPQASPKRFCQTDSLTCPNLPDHVNTVYLNNKSDHNKYNIAEFPSPASSRGVARERRRPTSGGGGNEGPHSGPDHREGLLLRAGQEPRAWL